MLASASRWYSLAALGEDVMAKQKRYSAELKFQVVLESLQRKRPDAAIARAYGVHPITLAKWKKQFLENGSEVFGGKEEMKRAQQHQARLERMVCQKEVEIALLRNFLGSDGDDSGNG
jgi:transposase-like protein